MRSLTVALALSSMLTVEQRDPRRAHLDPPSAAVSADGRYVAFTTFSQLAPADVDDHRDVYVLDRVNHRVTLESLPRDRYQFVGQLASRQSAATAVFSSTRRRVRLRCEIGVRIPRAILGEGRQPSISQNGRIAAFTSDTAKDIFVWSIDSGTLGGLGAPAKPRCRARRPSAQASTTTVATSPSPPGARSTCMTGRRTITERIADGWDPAISADGRYIAYVSRVGKLRKRAPRWIEPQESRRSISRSWKTPRRQWREREPSRFPRTGASWRFSPKPRTSLRARTSICCGMCSCSIANARMTLRVSGDPDAGWMEPSGGPALDAAGAIVAFSSRHPTDVSDKKNDFDLFVASFQ